ncbi:hypothetical protein niasHT_015138 [Heterodera trifolii]|uniref:Uncharacterized protein n=1 Tax=Heterodera trifolii TaxID=157864 RepID=A0ABD2LB78_9BILA
MEFLLDTVVIVDAEKHLWFTGDADFKKVNTQTGEIETVPDNIYSGELKVMNTFYDLPETDLLSQLVDSFDKEYGVVQALRAPTMEDEEDLYEQFRIIHPQCGTDPVQNIMFTYPTQFKGIMEFLLDTVVIVDAEKPLWFTGDADFKKVNTQTGEIETVPDNIYSGGSFCNEWAPLPGLKIAKKRNLVKLREIGQLNPELKVMNTFYDLPETDLLSQLVDSFDKEYGVVQALRAPTMEDEEDLYEQFRNAMKHVHSGDGPMKAQILLNPGQYVEKETRIGTLLDRIRRSGKKCFLLTNSVYAYTNVR